MTKLFCAIRCAAPFFATLLAVFLLNSVAAYAQTTQRSPDATTQAVPPPDAHDDSYKLGTGDQLRIIVFGETDLGGEYVVDSTGYVQMPLIGQVKATGASVHDFERAVSAKLADGYLKDPRVSIEVINYRPFYILGEVRSPGKYPYVSGMTILNAIAVAGGFTPRANDSDVYLRHDDSAQEVKVPVDGTHKVNPGDIIRVKERFF